MLLPCRTQSQLGSTVARQKHDSDSDVVPESYQIKDFLKPRNNSTCRNAIPPKYINVIYEFCLALQKHDVSETFESLLCQSRVARQSLSNLIECQT